MKINRYTIISIDFEHCMKLEFQCIEAKVRSVIKEVKCRVTFKGGLGSCTLSDDAIRPIDEQPLMQGANVKAKHPDKQEYLDAIINQIKVL